MIEKRFGGRLPHWRLPGALYFVTFRLHDALPADRVQAIRDWVKHEEARERDRLGRPLTYAEQEKVRQRSTGRLDRALDEGHGACHLRKPQAAQIVADVMVRGTEYRLHAYAVMPNHVHAIVHPDREAELSDIVGAWKSISSRELMPLLGISSPVWQKEPFDHVVRNAEKAREYTEYVLNNPIKARLKDWPYVGASDYGYDNVVWPFESS